MPEPNEPRKGDPVTYRGVEVGIIHRVEGNICHYTKPDGEFDQFIWRFRRTVEGQPYELNRAHDWPTKPSPSVYQRLKAAGCKISSRYSDLYVEATPKARAIIEAFQAEGGSCSPRSFKNQVEGGEWLDLPFCYDPWWEARATKRDDDDDDDDGGAAAEARQQHRMSYGRDPDLD